MTSLDRRHLRDGRHGRADAGGHGAGGAQVFFHTLGDRVTTPRIRCPNGCGPQVFDMQPTIQKALRSAQFDLVTLIWPRWRIPTPGHLSRG